MAIDNARMGRDPNFHVVPLYPGETNTTHIPNDLLMHRQVEIIAHHEGDAWRVSIADSKSLEAVKRWAEAWNGVS